MAGVEQISDTNSVWSYLIVLKVSAFTVMELIFTISNLASWRFWVFCYLSICITANMRISLADTKGSLSGFGCLVLLFLLFNLIGLASDLGGERFFPLTASSLGIVYSLLILALIMAVIGFVLTYLVSAIYVKVRRRHILNPF
jgi:hypothetical protein